MVLNIFPRTKKPAAGPEPELAAALPEPSPEALAALDDPEGKKRPTRRGSRGGRGRGRGNGAESAQDAAAEPETAAGEPSTGEPAPARTPRRSSRARTIPEIEPLNEPLAAEVVIGSAEPAAPTGRTPRAPRTPRQPAEPANEASTPPAAGAPRRGQASARSTGPDAEPTSASILRAIEQQSHQIEQLIRLQDDNVRRGGSPSSAAAAPPRVGIFVDSANIELACDRLKTRFDWKKILEMLTRDRQLIRAIAYSPVHDDPGVSIETQRFVEPFLGKGYKVFTKPLKRFQDNTIKANVDIELALDVLEMIDRLDIICLCSGDGDFQRLVEVAQSKGVRVEVVAVGSSTASNLRHAADNYIDLQSRLKEIRA